MVTLIEVQEVAFEIGQIARQSNNTKGIKRTAEKQAMNTSFDSILDGSGIDSTPHVRVAIHQSFCLGYNHPA